MWITAHRSYLWIILITAYLVISNSQWKCSIPPNNRLRGKTSANQKPLNDQTNAGQELDIAAIFFRIIESQNNVRWKTIKLLKEWGLEEFIPVFEGELLENKKNNFLCSFVMKLALFWPIAWRSSWRRTTDGGPLTPSSWVDEVCVFEDQNSPFHSSLLKCYINKFIYTRIFKTYLLHLTTLNSKHWAKRGQNPTKKMWPQTDSSNVQKTVSLHVSGSFNITFHIRETGSTRKQYFEEKKF